jgi:hypothetical protein
MTSLSATLTTAGAAKVAGYVAGHTKQAILGRHVLATARPVLFKRLGYVAWSP